MRDVHSLLVGYVCTFFLEKLGSEVMEAGGVKEEDWFVGQGGLANGVIGFNRP